MRKPLQARLSALTAKVRAQRFRPLAQGDPTRAVAYIRASTEEQKLTADAQRASIEDWATAARVEVVSWEHVDTLAGRTAASDRPGLIAAIATLRTSNCGIIVVAKRDRLARNTLEAALIEKMVNDAGGKLVSAAGEGDGETTEGKLIRTLMNAIAEFEGSRIRERIVDALAVKRARGELAGREPYGWRAIDPVRRDGNGRKLPRRLERVTDEQRVIAEAARLHADGHSYGAIAGELGRLGHKSRTGKEWAAMQVYRMVNVEERP